MKGLNLPDFATLMGHFRNYLPGGRSAGPIASQTAMVEFVGSRSAYIAQTTLYGYLKTRMGTRYPELFQDDGFVVAINRAKWQVCAACLSDLTVFGVAHCAAGGRLGSEDAGRMAKAMHGDAVAELFVSPESDVVRRDALPTFDARVAALDWSTIGEGEAAFSESPAGLVAAAPVADEFKAEDREIIENSMRFRWREVRVQFRKRAAVEAIVEDWRGRG